MREEPWAQGYFVSTVGRDEAVIREYNRRHEDDDKTAYAAYLRGETVYDRGGE
jgi:hypothetical protein